MAQQGIKMAAGIHVETVQIASGANGKTASIPTRGRTPRAVQTPAGFVTSDLTFEGSHDGTTFVPIVGLTLSAVEASQGVAIDPVLFGLWPFIKIVSVTDQTAARDVQLISQVV